MFQFNVRVLPCLGLMVDVTGCANRLIALAAEIRHVIPNIQHLNAEK